MSNYSKLEFITLDQVDSIDWLLKTCLSEREYAYKVIEDPRLWNISEFSLNFMEVYAIENNIKVCIGRFMYMNFIPENNKIMLFGLIVYPPYRNKGYGKAIINWVVNNTNVNRITTSNPAMFRILEDYGFRYIGEIESEYHLNGKDSVYEIISKDIK